MKRRPHDRHSIACRASKQFLGELMSIYAGSMLTYMIDIGHRTGLFTAAAAGPATSEDARRAVPA